MDTSTTIEQHETVPANDMDAVKRWLDTIGPADPSTALEYKRRARELAAEHGPAKASRILFTPLLDSWLDNLDKGDAHLDDDELLRLAVLIANNPHLRDALIMSLVTDLDHDELLTAATHAVPEVQRAVTERALEKAYNTRAVPNPDRIQTGLDMLAAINLHAPKAEYKAQPTAVIAYIMWWQGDPAADVYALNALTLDEECTLAQIILSACERGLSPVSAR